MVSENLAKGVLGFIDSIAPSIQSILPTPLDFLFAGVVGFIKGLIEELLT